MTISHNFFKPIDLLPSDIMPDESVEHCIRLLGPIKELSRMQTTILSSPILGSLCQANSSIFSLETQLAVQVGTPFASAEKYFIRRELNLQQVSSSYTELVLDAIEHNYLKDFLPQNRRSIKGMALAMMHYPLHQELLAIFQ